MAKLEISLFGPLRVLLNGGPVTQFESVKVRALLAFLATEYTRPHTRESLATLLWPDWPQQSAMSNLRYALADLRKNVGDREAQPPFLLVTRESLQFNCEADVQVDVGMFEEAINKQGIGDRGQGAQVSDLQSTINNLKSAISLYRGPFLDGFSLPDSAPFEEWLLAKREYFSQEMLKALSRLAELAIEQGEYDQAEGYARRQIELEPWREPAHQQLMRTLSLKGERVQALAQFESLRKALQRELKVEPSEDTIQLYQQIRASTLELRKTPMLEVKAEPLDEKSPAKLPTGTITFLFTDIEGSTPLWEREPEKMAAALQIHNGTLRQAIEANGGVVFKTVGDAFQIVFPTAPQALKAAIEGQHALQSAPWNELGTLKVRMGLHTGEAQLDPDGDEYAVSHTKNRIGRIHSAAYGGQILLSQEAADLVRRTLPEGVTLKDLGDHHLKGLYWPERLFQVCASGLPLDFPLLASAINYPNNLPVQLNSFIGREKEIDAVARLLQTARLVTLTGPGGTGKTRLALQTASGLLEQYADGVWLVELAPVADPVLVPTITAHALSLREQSGPQTVALLQEYLEPKHLLLILDNCEHVIEACVRLANTLLQACPKLSFLASSRESLGITGEVSYRVPPLSLPPYGATFASPPIESLGQYEAIRLFVERAAMVSPGFVLTSTNAPAILQVCQRLDGIPLAIELAAARVKLLQVNEIAQRLDDRFSLLTGGSRAALPRYQTLRASIDWSYELLSPDERTLLQRLSVFARGWVLEAAEAVGCGDGLQACDVLELLGMLVDKSLVQVSSEAAGLSRYRLLETIRQYAHEKLVESGQAEAMRQRHLQYYLELAERVGGKLRGPDQAVILDRLEAELDSLRQSLTWSLERRDRPGWDPEPGLRLAAALWWFWHSRGRQDEGVLWLEKLLAGEAEERGTKPFTHERIRCRAKALQVASWLAYWIDEDDKFAKMAEESRALYQSLGAEGRVGYAWACWGYDPSRNLAENQRIHERALAILREAGDRLGVHVFLIILGEDALFSNDNERAKTYWDENLALRKETGDLEGLAGAILEQSTLASYKGEFKQARALVEESMNMLSAVNSISWLGHSYLILSRYYMWEGNYEQGAIQVRKALSISRRQGDVQLLHEGLIALGVLALIQENYTEAKEAFEEDLEYARKKDHKVYIQEAKFYLGWVARACGNFEQAVCIYTEVLKNSPTGPYRWTAAALTELGKMSLARGENRQAVVYFKQASDAWDLINGPGEDFLGSMAILMMAQGQDEAASRLLGASNTWYTRYYHGIIPYIRQEWEACMAALRAAMGEQAYAAAFAEGQAMTHAQRWEYVKGLLPPE